jgi:hypothetical protein
MQAIGLAWESLHLLISHWSTAPSARHLMYDPAVLLIVVGFFASLVLLPVALEVARASQSDVEIPVYEPQESPEPERPSPRLRRRRLSH